MSVTVKTTQPRPYITTSTSNEWSSGICDCFDDLRSCCFAFWCFPCFACITSKKAGECLCLPLLDGFGCIPPITTAMRVSIRKQYGIEGTICRDCVFSFFCGPCSWCQISREMKIRKAPMIFAA
ncbi:cornifelin homolog A [Oryzias latipes]|uniref:Cornifelin homolog A n=2 Tax=Oryzias latipes TaxID=8090 RepID=A0A3P9I3T0_ORYLA|nr:cornifelin homolog A [Oryzias latipes]